MNPTLKTLLVSAALVPVAAMASDELSYSYVEASYVQTDLDDINVDGDGYGLLGSLAVAPNWHTFAGVSLADLDGVDIDTWMIGLGYNRSISDKADVIARLSYVRTEIDSELDVDDDGFGIGVGLRGRIAPAFELEGMVNYIDLGDLGDDTTFSVAGRYFFTPQFAAGLNVGIGDDATAYGVHFRLNFR